MPSDFSSYKVANLETSSDTKFDAFVQAVEDAINGIGALAVDPSQITGYPSDATKFLSGNGTWAVPAGGNKFVHGRIGSGGTVVEGTGFTAARVSTGKYTITFSPAFSSAPHVQTTPINNNLISYTNAATTTTVTCEFTSGSNVHTDVDFSFVAVGG